MAVLFAKNNSLSAVTSLPASISGGGFNLISTQTASSSSTIDFTSGIDSTYKEYIFKFINIHPETDEKEFQVNFSADSGSNYNVTKTTTFFQAYLGEAGDGSGETLDYATSKDLAQSTAYQPITRDLGNGDDESSSGFLHLFSPSDTTFVKHFTCVTNSYIFHNYTWNAYIAGYCNTTSAINAVSFKMSSGNIDSGTIKLYGVT